MTRKKILAKIPFELMSKELQVALKLEEQYYYAIIPESIFQKLGITMDKIILDLENVDNRLCLIGPHLKVD